VAAVSVSAKLVAKTLCQRDTDSAHVVVGPISWSDDDPDRDDFYFTVVKSEAGSGLCAAKVHVPDDVSNDVQDGIRSKVIAALIRRRPRPVIHSKFDDEDAMLRLCETLWRGERTAVLRQQTED
jgi:hypothetical protein